MAAVSPIPKIVTTAIKEDSSRDEEDYRDDWGKTEKITKIKAFSDFILWLKQFAFKFASIYYLDI